jgi:hypothetical protein
MYLIVSHWQAIPGHEKQFEETGHKMRAMLRKQPGTKFFEAFPSGDQLVVVHGYSDESSYTAVISDPDGPFVKALEEYKLEDHAKWLGSEKGTTVVYD